MKKKHFILITFTIVIISGCYTVLRHPEVPNQDEMGNVYHQNINPEDNCYSCHSQRTDMVSDYDRYMNYYSDYNTNNYYPQNRWDSYYNVPWWFTPPKVTVGAGSKPNNNNTVNRTTSNQDNNVRSTGTTRGDVKITAPAPTRGTTTNTNSNSTNNSNDKKEDNKTTTRTNDNNSNIPFLFNSTYMLNEYKLTL